MSAFFEVVRGNGGHRARLVATNGQVLWETANYQRPSRAVAAINSLATVFYGHVMHGKRGVTCLSARDSWNKADRSVAEIRYVDERATP